MSSVIVNPFLAEHIKDISLNQVKVSPICSKSGDICNDFTDLISLSNGDAYLWLILGLICTM